MEKVQNNCHHILLVEDTFGDEVIFKDILSRSIYNTSCDAVTNGEDALDYLRRKGNFSSVRKPDLVVMDLTLPRIDGIELLKMIKNDPELKTTPVVIFTGSELPDDIKRAYLAGANGYMSKPTGLKQLEEKIKNLEDFWFDTALIPSQD
ncbi:MAG: response regulator [Methanomassiliicoccales archaeon]|jgi:two-component system response regulator